MLRTVIATSCIDNGVPLRRSGCDHVIPHSSRSFLTVPWWSFRVRPVRHRAARAISRYALTALNVNVPHSMQEVWASIGAQPHGLTPDGRPDARDHGFVEQVAADGMAVAPVFRVIGAARRPPRGPHGSISRYVSTSAPGSRSRSADLRGSGACVACCPDARERIICAYAPVRRGVHLRAGRRPRTGSSDERRGLAEGLVPARLTPIS